MMPDEAYLAGYTIGDGNLYTSIREFSLNPGKKLRKYEITWADADEKQLVTVAEIVKNNFQNSIHLRLKKRTMSQCFILRCSRRAVYQWLESLLEQDIEKLPAETVANFIGGFFDAEGCVQKTLNRRYRGKAYYKIRLTMTQKDRGILEKMRKLLIEHFGITSNIHKKWNQDAYVLQSVGRPNSQAFFDNIGFRNSKKREKLKDLLSSVHSSPKLH